MEAYTLTMVDPKSARSMIEIYQSATQSQACTNYSPRSHTLVLCQTNRSSSFDNVAHCALCHFEPQSRIFNLRQQTFTQTNTNFLLPFHICYSNDVSVRHKPETIYYKPPPNGTKEESVCPSIE